MSSKGWEALWRYKDAKLKAVTVPEGKKQVKLSDGEKLIGAQPLATFEARIQALLKQSKLPVL